MQIYLDRNIDLDQPIVPEIIKDAFFSTEQYAHVLRLQLNRSGTAVSWQGHEITAYAVREDGTTVLLSGSLSGDYLTCSIELPYDCYLCPGRLTVTVHIDNSDELLAVCCLHFIVVRATTDTQTDPTHSFPSVQSLDDRVTALEQGQTTGSVTGVKGDSESTYRTGQVNITAANVGAASLSDMQQLIAAAKLAMFPVGSIYMSISSTDPGTFIGGTWTRIQDTFLLAAGSTYAAGATGGEATHTLTSSEMPKHKHEGLYWQSIAAANQIGLNNDNTTGYQLTWTGNRGPNTNHKLITAETGSGTAHNNMPPYLAVYVWKRTA